MKDLAVVIQRVKGSYYLNFYNISKNVIASIDIKLIKFKMVPPKYLLSL